MLDAHCVSGRQTDFQFLLLLFLFVLWFRFPSGTLGLLRLLSITTWNLILVFLRYIFLAIPRGVLEVLIRLHEVIDGEVILALVETGSTTDYLLELYH